MTAARGAPAWRQVAARWTARHDAAAGARGIVPLQLLRGVAATGVVIEHLLQRYGQRGALVGELPGFAERLGQTGVAAFFAISGFIMVHVAYRGDGAGRDPSPGDFLRSRYLRVAPLYYLTTLLMIAFEAATRAFSTRADARMPTLDELALSFAFVPHRGANGLIQPVYELGWTLQYEMFFYLLFALGLLLPGRRGGLAVMAALLALVAIGTGVGAPPVSRGVEIAAYVFTRPILLFFAVGIALGLLRRRWQARLPMLPAPVMALAGLAGLALAATRGEGAVALVGVGFALACNVLVRAAPPVGRAGRSFAAASQGFGDASYSVYLTHSFLLGAFAAVTAPLAARGPVALVALLLLGGLCCTVAGWIVWRLVEVPIDRRLRGRKPGAL